MKESPRMYTVYSGTVQAKTGYGLSLEGSNLTRKEAAALAMQIRKREGGFKPIVYSGGQFKYGL